MLEASKIKSKIIEAMQKEIDSAHDLATKLRAEVAILESTKIQVENELKAMTSKMKSKEDAEHIINHDLRNSLSSLVSLPEFLMDIENLNEEDALVLNEISRRAKRMLSLVDMNLLIIKLEQGELASECVKVNLEDAMSQIISQNKIASKVKNIEVNMRCLVASSNSSCGCAALANETLVFNILNNLLINAIEASLISSEIIISVRSNSFCTISIRNSGEVPEEIRGTFFEKFVTSGKKFGTGIGTYSSMLMVKAMGGNISLDCSEAKFTTIEVKLPKYV